MSSSELSSDQGFDVESIWRDYSLFVYRLCLRFTLDKAHAEDLRQEVFLRIMASGNSYRGDSGLKTWIHSITRNCCMDFFRWQRRQRLEYVDRHEFDTMPEKYSLVLTDSLACSWHPDSRFAACTPMERSFLELHFREGLSYREIAILFGTTRGTVGKKMNRALACLKNEHS